MPIDDSLPCQAPNVFGCPNHGEAARAFRRWARDGVPVPHELVGRVSHSIDNYPVDYWLTEKGHAVTAILSMRLSTPS